VFDLATSRYQAGDLILASRLVPVGISIGEPKFPLGYPLLFFRRLAPWGLREIGDEAEFTLSYRDQLDAIGLPAIRRDLHRLSTDHDGRGLVLLCFEPPGVFCHRRVFAAWFEEQTGEHVPELQPAQLELGDSIGE
jgi:hypothetical protein